MEIEYLNSGARRAATSPGEQPWGWNDAEVSRLRLIVQCVHASRVPGDLLSLRSLCLLADPDDPGQVRTELSPDRGLTLGFKANSSRVTALLDVGHTRMDPRR